MEESTREGETKATYSGRQVICMVFRACVGDDGHPLQNLLEVFQHLFFG
jgi:hypothetical protein